MMSPVTARRIAMELKNTQAAKSPKWIVSPLPNNNFEWHFTLRGAQGTDYEGGLYHGKIILPPEFPNKAPDIFYITENGRFEPGEKICLTATSWHPEHWTPTWTIIMLLEAMWTFFLTEGSGIGYVAPSGNRRKELAKASRKFTCEHCGMSALAAEKILIENEKNVSTVKPDIIYLNSSQSSKPIPQNQFGLK